MKIIFKSIPFRKQLSIIFNSIWKLARHFTEIPFHNSIPSKPFHDNAITLIMLHINILRASASFRLLLQPGWADHVHCFTQIQILIIEFIHKLASKWCATVENLISLTAHILLSNFDLSPAALLRTTANKSGVYAWFPHSEVGDFPPTLCLKILPLHTHAIFMPNAFLMLFSVAIIINHFSVCVFF